MENSLIDPNKGIIFHPVYSDNTTTEEKNKIAEHVDKHYRKYLFGIGALSGFMVALFSRVFFGTSATTSSTSAAYESLAPEVNAVLVFNQMDAIAHEKDNFFHQTGKIYTMTGETLFHRYDTMFHVLDNAYHRSIDSKEKLKRAQKLETFIKTQNELFASTTYVNAEQDKKFETLDSEFLQILGEMEGKNTMTGDNKTLTGTIIAQ